MYRYIEFVIVDVREKFGMVTMHVDGSLPLVGLACGVWQFPGLQRVQDNMCRYNTAFWFKIGLLAACIQGCRATTILGGTSPHISLYLPRAHGQALISTPDICVVFLTFYMSD